MKKLTYMAFAILLALASCQKYDHTAILNQLRDHEERIQKLETLCNRLNTNISAMQALLVALQENDYITGITPLMENGKEVGYTIYFSKGLPMTIYHGSNGEDAPKVGVRKASDGKYYWAVGDEWLTDEDGSMIPATSGGENGEDNYITPEFRVAEGCWYISYDGGNTWRILGKVEEEAETFIVDIKKDDSYYLFYFNNGTLFKIPSISPEQISGSHWKGKVWYAYGTSLTSTSQGRYVDYLAELSGLVPTNKGIPGGGIVTNTKIKDAVMKTTDGKQNADLITLEVGANDGSAELGNPWDNCDSTFCGALTKCINYLLQNTRAQIVVMSSPMGGYKANPADENYKYVPRNNAIKEVCMKCGVYYIGLDEGSGLGWGRTNNNMGDSYLSDHIHHTHLGGYNIAQFIWSELKDIPLWYTSIPQPDDEEDNDEEDTEDGQYLFIQNHKELTNSSYLGSFYFYFSGDDVIKSLEGKTVNGVWCMIGKETSGSSTITAYLVDLSNPTPPNWKEIGSTTVSNIILGTHIKFDIPETVVPANHTIGFRSSKSIVGTAKGKTTTVAKQEYIYYESATATTAKNISMFAYDIRLK
jgi:hypothetical protein